MKIVIGLGNPGPEYEGTRHNAGIDFVDTAYSLLVTTYRDTYGWRRKKDIMTAVFPDVVLVKTAGVFMNESGKIIQELKQGGYESLYLAHDDLDIRLGEYKIQFGTGPKVHNGLLAVERALGTKEFWRIRIGIDSRRVEERESISGEQFVLQRFNEQERKVLDKVINRAAEEVLK